MRFSRVKEKMRQGKPAMIVTCHFADPAVYEMTSLMGFDGIWIDLEHHAHSLETATALMRAARVGTSDILARPSSLPVAVSPPIAGAVSWTAFLRRSCSTSY